ncbi:MAG: glycoside hydrolase family 38 C-terminal domain-containing protein, partial [Chloroflexota bacterium]
LRAGDFFLENRAVRLELDPTSGRIASLIHRASGVDLADPSRPGAVVLQDTTDTWSHRALAYREEIGAFEPVGVRLVESGPVRAILRAESAFGASTLVQDYVLGAPDDAVELRVILDWHEQARLLKLRFPTRLEAVTATYEIPYGTIERPPNGEEEPGQRWVDVTGSAGEQRVGLAVLNDGKYSFDVDGDSIGVTAVRSPIFAHHDPTIPRPGVRYQFQDQGQQRFTVALMPHGGEGWIPAVTRRAALLNQRPATLLESQHPGDLPATTSYVAVEPGNVVLGAVKLAEDPGGDLVVRLVETAGQACRAVVRMADWGREFSVQLGASEIRTFRVPAAPAAAVVETDLLEWPLAAAEPLAAPEPAPENVDASASSEPPVDGPDRPAPTRGDPIAEVAG